MLGSPIGNAFTNLFLGIWIYILIINRRYSKKTSILICVATSLICEALSLAFDIAISNHLFNIFANIGLAIVYLLVFMFILSNYDDSKIFFLYLIYVTIWNMIGFTSSILTNTTIGSYKLECCLIYAVLNMLCMFVYIRYFSKKIPKALANFSYNMTFVNFACFYIIIMMVALMIVDFFAGQVSIYTTIFLLITLPILFSIYYFFNKSFMKSFALTESEQIFLRNQVLTNFIDSTNSKESINQQLSEGLKVIYEHAKDNDSKAIIDYVNQFHLEPSLPYVLSNNDCINATLCAYYIVCKQNKIEFIYTIDQFEDCFIDCIDLNSLISNILDDCIKKVEQCENKFISLSITNHHKTVIIESKASITTKNSDSLTNDIPNNLAIAAINQIVKKYDGQFHYTDNSNCFCSTITIHNK